MKGMDGSTPVLKAIAAKDIKTLKVLVTHPKTDLNKEVLCANVMNNYQNASIFFRMKMVKLLYTVQSSSNKRHLLSYC